VDKSNHNKTEKRPEKIILRLDAAIRKQKSSCRYVDEDADADVVALIFNGAAMEKMIPPFPFTVDRDEEKEEIKLQYQVIWHGETLTLMTRSTEKNLLKTMDSHSLQPPVRCRRRREGDQQWWMAGAALGQESKTTLINHHLQTRSQRTFLIHDQEAGANFL
jgi:hypothetical protein